MSFNAVNLQSSATALSEQFSHGGGIEAAARGWGCEISDILDLSTGLHPAGAPAWLPEWMQKHATLAAHYPDTNGEPARSALAAELAVAPENVVIIAGAQALIEVVFTAMGWRSLAIEVPCYSEPLRCARRAGCRLLPFEQDQPIPQAEVLWWTSPANPHGGDRPFPGGFSGLLDESYMVFAERRRLGLIPGVIRLGSLTKSLCIPGLRLGYAVADAVSVERLKQWLPPWPASTLALHLLPALLPEADRRDAAIAVARRRLAELLGRSGWQLRPSAASFLLARPEKVMPAFAEHRILVRHFPEWPQLTGWVRFGLPGSEADWKRLEEVLCRSH